MFVYICCLAHLNQRLIREIGYSGHLSSVRPLTFSNGYFSETTEPIYVSLVEIHLKVYVRMQTRSYADTVADAEAGLDPHQKQYDVLSFHEGDIIRSRLVEWSLRYPCYNVYTTDKGRTAGHWL